MLFYNEFLLFFYTEILTRKFNLLCFFRGVIMSESTKYFRIKRIFFYTTMKESFSILFRKKNTFFYYFDLHVYFLIGLLFKLDKLLEMLNI